MQRPFLQRIFINPEENRLRAGWRIFVQTIAAIILLFVLRLLFTFLFSHQKWEPSLLSQEILPVIGLTASIFISRRWIDHRSIRSLGLNWNRQALFDVLHGIWIAGVVMGAIFFAEMELGWLKLSRFAWQEQSPLQVISNLAAVALLFILVGWQEELLSRGYHLQNLADGLNLTWGVVISSTMFALLHLGNPNITWVAVLGLLLAGFFLAFGYLRTRQLWLSIGLHIGWNFFEGTIFGFPVSGLNIYRLLHSTISGPELWTGGPFGPEAGLIVIPAMALGVWLMILITQQRKRN